MFRRVGLRSQKYFRFKKVVKTTSVFCFQTCNIFPALFNTENPLNWGHFDKAGEVSLVWLPKCNHDFWITHYIQYIFSCPLCTSALTNLRPLGNAFYPSCDLLLTLYRCRGALLKWAGMKRWGKCQTPQYFSSSLIQPSNGKTSAYGTGQTERMPIISQQGLGLIK